MKVKDFKKNYKKWFLETQIGEEYPMGPPKSKQQKEVVEEVVEEQVV